MKTIRLLAIVLAFTCVLTGCSLFGGNAATTPEGTTTESPVLTPTTPEATTPEGTTPPEVTTPENTTPEETTPETPPVVTPPEKKFVLTHVTILSGDAPGEVTPAEVTAASELTEYLQKRGITVATGGFPITLSIDTTTLGEDSYRITAITEGENAGMQIVGGNGRGILYGVYGFLEKYAGLRSYTPTLEVFPTEGDITITEGTLMEFTPVFEMRVNDWYRWAAGNPEMFSWCVKNGVNMVDGWWAPWSEDLGGAWDYGGYFVHTIGSLTGTGGGATANPCLTNPDNLARAIAAVRERLASRPSTTILSVSQNDTDARCRCANCAAIDAEEGSPAGTLLRFVNAIANDIAEDYPNVTIDTLAYDYTQTAPKITRPAENVCIRLCTFHCHFTHPLTEQSCGENARFCRDLEEWSKICDNIHIWDYTTNFAFYIPTYANLHVLQQNMQYFAEHNAKGMFPQGNRNSTSGEFGELRAYLLAKLMMNPYMGEEEYYRLMDEFLQAYYGDGWAYIRMYIDKTSEMYSGSCRNMYTHPLDMVPAEEFRKMQPAFNDWWAKAEALADEARVDNVRKSSLQWRFFLARFDKTLQPAFEQEVRDRGIFWSEDNWQYSRW